jgi:acetylornithine deacetylase
MVSLLSARERNAIASIERDQIVRELCHLVSIPSVTGAEDAVQREMAMLMRQIGLDVVLPKTDLGWIVSEPGYPGTEVERSSLPIVAGHLRGRPGPRLLLVAHVDVVPPGQLSQWSSDPFVPVVKNGFVYGRGACDMKGGAVALLAALRAVQSVGGPNYGEIILVSVPSEEDGGAGMFAAIKHGYTGDAAVIAEPTSLDIVTVQAGAFTFRLTVPGRAAHGAVRLSGVSALDNLFLLLEALRRNEKERNASEWRPELRALDLPYPTSIGRIRGGDWASTVPDEVVVEGRYGVRLGQTTDEAAIELRSVVSDACDQDGWLREHPATVEISGGRFAAVGLAAADPLPGTLANIAAVVTGREAKSVGVPYGSDMSSLIELGKTPTVLFGPGTVTVAHSPDERVSLEEVMQCAQILTVWLLRASESETSRRTDRK